MRRGTQDVGVVMLDALAGHVGVMAVGCSNVRELVGCDARAGTWTHPCASGRAMTGLASAVRAAGVTHRTIAL
jgi:hypothetical protein